MSPPPLLATIAHVAAAAPAAAVLVLAPYAAAFDAAAVLPAASDPGAAIVRAHSGRKALVSFVAPSDPQLLSRLVAHLPDIFATPTVLHIAIHDDLSDVLLLRSAVPFFLLSTNAQQAHDHALLASKLACAHSAAVVHAFYLSDASPDHVPKDRIASFLAESTATPTSDLYEQYEAACAATAALTGRPLLPLRASGDPNPSTVLVVAGSSSLPSLQAVSVITLSLLSPLPHSALLAAIPSSATRVITLEQVHRWNMKWLPVYFDVVTILQDSNLAVHSAVLGDTTHVTADQVTHLVQSASTASPSGRLLLGSLPQSQAATPPHVPQHELSYTKILDQIFLDRLEISNSPALVSSQGEMATRPEFALGRVRGQLDKRTELVAAVEKLLQDTTVDSDTHLALSKWMQLKDNGAKSKQAAADLLQRLQALPTKSAAVERVLALKDLLPARSRWILGSDAWSYDLGSSGLHHVISSGLNVNILILDSLPYSARNSADPSRRKHDVGLYAMNYGNVYVASVAVYSSYAHVLQALMEADRYNGPSVVLAYLPYKTEHDPAISVLKETKLAVDSGYWPLYRWDPSKEAAGKEPFSLDSDSVKNDLQAFLDRQNHLSQLVKSKPELASEIVSSLGETVKEARKKRALSSFNSLVADLDAPPLLILFASDGGAAEKVAKRLQNRSKLRGLSASLATIDSFSSIDTLAQEEYVVFITSTAGQGEPPQNARKFVKAANAAAAASEKHFSKLKYAVFGMGDSHYWPRPEDAHYYNKPGKDLDQRLEQLGGERVIELGLGDDQDADGYETGYKAWEPLVWKLMGVDGVKITEAEPETITNEHIKAASNYLRGTIAQGLIDDSTGALHPSDGQLTKFHGIYEQDDRDIRDDRLAQGIEPAYAFMIRVRLPAGVCTAKQWLLMDEISDTHGCGNFKLTTRQTFQFHGVIKKKLKSAMQAINRSLLDTIAACGDVNRNVICCNIPTLSRLHAQCFQMSKDLSAHLLPKTAAYHEIWLDKKMIAGDALKQFTEPLYGEFYLPRKFKIAIAVPPYNDVDVFANDLGFIAITDEKGDLAGFNVSIGGGMGVTHGNKKTYPRTGTVIGFCTVDKTVDVAEKVMLVQRDFGNRKDRKNARLKYTVDRMGVDGYKAEMERRLGYQLEPARPYELTHNIDTFGWVTGEDGRHHFTMFIENGRVEDAEGRNFKTGLRELAAVHKGSFRLTTNQHLIISDVDTEDLDTVKDILAKYKMDNLDFSALRLSSSACVAFPTCGLAMAESERYLPILIDKVEKLMEESGLRHDSIVMRMTGCPNGCARPYIAEVAFVGKAPGTYSMLLGGGYYGQRLNKIFRETVTEKEILEILGPMIKRYALERNDGEHFGDWTIRAGYIAPTVSGALWYDKMGGEGEHREVAVAA